MLRSMPAMAQSGNLSDVTGNIVTTSDIAGGVFQSSEDNGDVNFRDATIAATAEETFSTLVTQLRDGELSIPSTGWIPTSFGAIEQSFSNQFTDYFGLPAEPSVTLSQVQEHLKRIEDQTGSKVGVIYVVLATDPIVPSLVLGSENNQNTNPSWIDIDLESFQDAQRDLAQLSSLATLRDTDRQRILALMTQSEGSTIEGADTAIADIGASINWPETQVIQLTKTVQQLQSLLILAGVGAADVPQTISAIAAIIDSGKISAAQLQVAIAAYNTLINRADLTFLEQPPADFHVFQSVLEQLIATLRTEHGSSKSWPTFPLKQGQSNIASSNVDHSNKQKESTLQLMLITASKVQVVQQVGNGITGNELIRKIQEFRGDILSPIGRLQTRYLASAKQLYDWFIQPLQTNLDEQDIDTIVFATDMGLRFTPLAALHDGEKFLVEKYAVGLIPSFSLTNTEYTDLRDDHVLAMGASEFSDQPPLPAALVEVATVSDRIWHGQSFVNENFTLDNLKQQSLTNQYRIIHLATHATFQQGDPQQSYIQLWDTRLRLDEMPQLQWGVDTPIDLVVLSACQTALGNTQAELGFAGFALQSGAKSALASIWKVSDEGTLGLMAEFHHQLRQQTTKAQALRQAQLAMLQGKIRFEDRQLRWSEEAIALPQNLHVEDQFLSHPYYWAGFTMIGSPW